MSNSASVAALDHAVQSAQTWVHDVAHEFDTKDLEFAYRVLRAWLHTLRDRISVQASANFAAQLPDLIRGVFYAGWDPSAVPEKYNAHEYVLRFARDATIGADDVGKAASATTAAALHHLPAAQIEKVFEQLPADIRAVLQPKQ
jgi:uncharacterized protein (DUF2267 family)